MKASKGGRPKTELSEAQIKEIETLAAVLNQDQIADYLSIPSRTLRAIISRDEPFLPPNKKEGQEPSAKSVRACLGAPQRATRQRKSFT